MSIRIFHISDVHIGMKFAGYPENVRKDLVEARFSSVEKAVDEANRRHCDLLVVAGDLFESLKVPMKDMERVNSSLGKFSGDYVLILPGNHDYYDESVGFWDKFSRSKGDSTLIFDRCGRIDLHVGEKEVSIFASPCDSKHSSTNRLGWIRDEKPGRDNVNILIAHGAIREVSPDLNSDYFTMGLSEISDLGMDLSLLGHTHVPYPLKDNLMDSRTFNAGTPEPDGLNYRHEGSGWYIEIGDDRSVSAERVALGSYRFFDDKLTLDESVTKDEIAKRYLERGAIPQKAILRLGIVGYIDQDAYDSRNELYKELGKEFKHLEIIDDDLKVRFSSQIIEQEFTRGSLPYVFLSRMLEETDEDTAHLAYELLRRVRKNDKGA